jgi:hypothetical protein
MRLLTGFAAACLTALTAACGPSPASEPSAAVASAASSAASAPVSAAPVKMTEPAPQRPGLNDPHGQLAAASNGLDLASPDGRIFKGAFLSGDNSCSDPEEGSVDGQPFTTICVWPDTGGQEDLGRLYLGVNDGRIVSVMTREHAEPLAGWSCSPAERLPRSQICNAASASPADKTRWTEFWNTYINVWVLR